MSQGFRLLSVFSAYYKRRQNERKLIILGTKMIFFFWRGAQPPPAHPTPLDAYGASTLLTEILNTPLLGDAGKRQ